MPTALRWEWVVVDSSPEQSLMALREAHGLPLRHVVAPADGIYRAMNLGIAASKCAYLWFLNGGDELDGEAAISAALRAADGADLVWAGVRLVEDGRVIRDQLPSTSLKKELRGINRVCHQGLIFSRRLFQPPFGPYDPRYRIVADYEHLLRCEKEGIRVGRCQEALARFHKGGLSDRAWPALREFGVLHWRARAFGQLIPWIFASLVVMVKRGSRFLPGGEGIRRALG